MKRNKFTVFVDKHGSTILTVIGAVGVVATGVLAAKETPKALKLLDDAKEEKGEELTKTEIIVNAGRAYIPAISVGASTIMCIFGANCLNKKQQAQLVSAYNLLVNYHKEYRRGIINLTPEDLKDKDGKQIDTEVRAECVRRWGEEHMIGVDIPDQKVIFVEENSQQRLYAYEREVMDAEYHINRNFALGGWVSVNDLLDMLGLEEIGEDGDTVGWDITDGFSFIDFQHIKIGEEDGTPIYLISTLFPASQIED